VANAFADWLTGQIRERGWETLRDAGQRLGVGHSSLSRYLNGQQAPSRQNLKKIVAALGADRDHVEGLLAEQDRASANQHGVPADVNAFGMPRGFGEMVWDRLSPEAKERIIEIVRIELEEEAERSAR
jgi:transcriptional regulator with XRE-family HTH domain